MSGEDKHLHINIFKDNKDKIDTASNKSEMYLILMNESLNNTIKMYLDDLSTSKQENDSLTDDNERMEKSLTYQRGLLQNFHAINNCRKELNDVQDSLIVLNQKHIKQTINLYDSMIHFISFILYSFITLLVLAFAIGLLDVFQIVVFTLLIILSVSSTVLITKFDFTKYSFKLACANYSSENARITINFKKSQNKIEEMDKNNNHITEFIDSI